MGTNIEIYYSESESPWTISSKRDLSNPSPKDSRNSTEKEAERVKDPEWREHTVNRTF